MDDANIKGKLEQQRLNPRLFPFVVCVCVSNRPSVPTLPLLAHPKNSRVSREREPSQQSNQKGLLKLTFEHNGSSKALLIIS